MNAQNATTFLKEAHINKHGNQLSRKKWANFVYYQLCRLQPSRGHTGKFQFNKGGASHVNFGTHSAAQQISSCWFPCKALPSRSTSVAKLTSSLKRNPAATAPPPGPGRPGRSGAGCCVECPAPGRPRSCSGCGRRQRCHPPTPPFPP